MMGIKVQQGDAPEVDTKQYKTLFLWMHQAANDSF